VRVPSSPILISSNAGFASKAVRGDGTLWNPWVIENLMIDRDSANGIQISNMGSSVIYMDNVTNGVIKGCAIHDNAIDGISVFNSANTLIDGNIVMNNAGHGINAISVSNLRINENEIYDNDYYDSYSFFGIYLGTSDGNKITGNEFYSNGFFGILIIDGSNNLIDGNYIHDELEGVGIFPDAIGVDSNSIINNKFQNFAPDWSDPSTPLYLTIWMGGATNTIISGNDFIDCDGGVDAVHVVDDSADTTCSGNYWSNDPNMDGTPFFAIDSDYDGVADVADTSPSPSLISKLMSYHIERAPITISDDSDFTPANGVIAGDGSADNPYIISGW
jgi:parallel beta-helix repeat protein